MFTHPAVKHPLAAHVLGWVALVVGVVALIVGGPIAAAVALFVGALYLGMLAMIPLVAFVLINANQNFPFGGTSLLIIVGVGLETVKQIDSQMQQRHYEGLLR